MFGPLGNFTSATMDYVKKPAKVKLFPTGIVAGQNVLIVGKTYYVSNGTITNGTQTVSHITNDPSIDENFFVATNVVMIGGGTVHQVINCDLPDNEVQEEVARFAGMYLSGTVMEFKKSEYLMSLMDL
jgi:hypothetical protein